MAHPLPKLVVSSLLLLLVRLVSGQLDDSSAAFINPLLYDDHDDVIVDHDDVIVSYDNNDNDNEEQDPSSARRGLFWQRAHYYISYAAMSANHVPCRPVSGNSYYNHHCNRLSGPVHPYFRSCSAITRCRR